MIDDNIDNDPRIEAAHLRKLADDIMSVHPEEDSMSISSPRLRALLYLAEAAGLERGYEQGRVRAAYAVRVGMDAVYLNGGVRWDSDVEPPPVWLLNKAERLARGRPL